MKINDNEIVLQLEKNPEKGFSLLMQRFKEPVYWHIRRIVVSHSDAQDASQETFLRVFRSFNDLRNKESLTAWIYRIATNEAVRLLRIRIADTMSIASSEGDIMSLRADEYFDYSNIEAVRLQKAINTLPPKQKLAFTLRYYDDLSYNDIAEVMDSTPDNAKMNYHIAKNKIINYMNSND